MKADNDNGKLGKVYTLAEAAEHLRMTNRGIAKIAKRHGLCMVNGRNILFTDGDIENIKDILRCPSNSTNVVRSGGSAGPISSNLYAELQGLLTEKSQKRSSQRRLRA